MQLTSGENFMFSAHKVEFQVNAYTCTALIISYVEM